MIVLISVGGQTEVAWMGGWALRDVSGNDPRRPGLRRDPNGIFANQRVLVGHLDDLTRVLVMGQEQDDARILLRISARKALQYLLHGLRIDNFFICVIGVIDERDGRGLVRRAFSVLLPQRTESVGEVLRELLVGGHNLDLIPAQPSQHPHHGPDLPRLVVRRDRSGEQGVVVAVLGEGGGCGGHGDLRNVFKAGERGHHVGRSGAAAADDGVNVALPLGAEIPVGLGRLRRIASGIGDFEMDVELPCVEDLVVPSVGRVVEECHNGLEDVMAPIEGGGVENSGDVDRAVGDGVLQGSSVMMA
mmetsp:Transcript_2865/g.8046  ORF Transcript_2865/g.8046 Transcript_2865/m.8046 type:complete len:303 (-) Transcript_2865:315-1223(-)